MINKDIVPATNLTSVAQKISVLSSNSFIMTIPTAINIMDRQPIIIPGNRTLFSEFFLSEGFFLFMEPTPIAERIRMPPIIVLIVKLSPRKINAKKITLGR